MNLIETMQKVVEAGGIGEADRQEVMGDLVKAIVVQTIDELPPEEKIRLTTELQSRPADEVYRELSQTPSYAESFHKATEFVLADWLAEVMPEDEEAQQETMNKLQSM